MKPQDQRYFPVPGVSRGDCWRACIASITETHIDLVPHFILFENWVKATNLWLAARDLQLEPGYASNPAPPIGEFVILGGVSPRDPNRDNLHDVTLFHAVVAEVVEHNPLIHQWPMEAWPVAHDPHPSRAGVWTRSSYHRIVKIEPTAA